MNHSKPNHGTVKRILLADACAAERARLHQALRQLPFIEIVGEAGDAKQTLELFFATKPGMVVASVSLPEYGGFHVLRCIKRAAAHCVVVLTTREFNPYVEEAAGLLGADAVCSAGRTIANCTRCSASAEARNERLPARLGRLYAGVSLKCMEFTEPFAPRCRASATSCCAWARIASRCAWLVKLSA